MSIAFDIFNKTDLTSKGGLKSNAANISWVVPSSWFKQELDGQKTDWLGFISSSSNRKLYILLKIIFLKKCPKIGKREIGR